MAENSIQKGVFIVTKQISPERKKFYRFGLVLQVIGGCLFALPFLTIPIIIIAAMVNGDPEGLEILAPIAFGAAFIGFGLIVGGGAMRGIAAKGTAGSGLVLDPEKAREDLKPWTGMAGGMVKDVLDEADIKLNNLGGGGSQPEKVIMIKCRECGKLNEEDSKFCQECGKPI
jgi:hypothetical protein